MNTRARVALTALVFASAFTAGVVGGAHDFVAAISGAPLGASLLSAGREQLAFGGFTGSNSSSGSSGGGSPSASSEGHGPTSSGGGGNTNSGTSGTGGSTNQGRGGSPVGGGGGGGGSSPSASSEGHGPTSNSGGGNSNGGNNTNSQSQQQGRGGAAPQGGSDPAMGGSNSTPSTPDSRDHQDTTASRAAEAQAAQTRQANDAASYANSLNGSGDPTAAARTQSSISATISNTWNALNNAWMGVTNQPSVDTNRTVTGMDGNTPTYNGTGLSASDFGDPAAQTQAPGYSTGAPTDYTGAMNTAATTDATPHYVTSAATEQAIKTMKQIDKDTMEQAALFQSKYQKDHKSAIDTASAILGSTQIAKMVAGECASGACSNQERIAIANVFMNRFDVKVANKANVDIHDVLDAFDSNMQRDKTPDNKVYAKADLGTPEYAAGAAALKSVLNGNLPADMPDSVKNATNYHTLNTHPDWAKGVAETPYGPHTFSNADGSTAEQVQAAKDKVAAGDVKANISFYSGMYNSASPQAAKIQSEVSRSLTVAGRSVNVVTRSTGVTQGPGLGQGTKPAAGVAATSATNNSAASNVSTQKTSLDDPKNSNVPSPADVKSYLAARGWPAATPINGQYAYRLSNVIARAESATGYKAPSNYLSSTYRTPEQQAQIKATSLGKDYTYNGTVYSPDMSNPYVGTNFKAAAPDSSPHQYGEAVDTVDTSTMKDPQAKAAAEAINGYIQSNTPMHNALKAGATDPNQTGLERVTNDQNHVEMAGFTPKTAQSLSENKLDSSIGATQQNTAQQPAAGGLFSSLTKSLPSLDAVKQKATEALKAVTPSEETQQKLSWVGSLPTWAQNIVMSIYTGKGGTGGNTEGSGGHGGSSFFPEAKRATTTISTRTSTKVDVTTLPWWQQYQAKLDAIKQNQQQQSI